MFDLTDKEEIMPFVMLYRNALKNPGDILEIAKKTETENQDVEGATKWEQWYDFGIQTHFSKQSKNSEPEIKLFNTLNELINAGYSEYINDWVKKEKIEMYRSHNHDHWKEVFGGIVTDWDYIGSNTILEEDFETCTDVMNVEGSPGWIESSISISKHKPDTQRKYAIGYHLDSSGEIVTPGPKAILTATVYLNDDYDGGGVSFLNEFEDTIINYKPSAGDLMIFPSAKPFFHAALPLTGGLPKYFARHFLTWKHVGSEDWSNGIKDSGESFMTKLYTEIRKRENAMGFYTKSVFLPGEEFNSAQHGFPFFAKKVIDWNKENGR
jgi:hypothetical protein